MESRVSFTSVLTVVTLILSLVPAITIWVVFMDLMTSSVDLLRGTTQASTDSMAQALQQLMILRAIDRFDARLTEGNNEMAVLIAAVQASGLQGYDLRPSRFDPRSDLPALHRLCFAAIRGHPYFSTVIVAGGLVREPSNTYVVQAFWATWVRYSVDIMTQRFTPTVYSSSLVLAPDEQSATVNISYADQVTGQPLFLMSSQNLSVWANPMVNVPSGWDTKLYFNKVSGQVELAVWQWLAAQNGTWLRAYISISASTISDELLAELSTAPDDRLVLFARQPHGYMMAASHGKYWSDSDEDRRAINPLTNPPNVSAYRLWNCTRSTDALIQQACQQLYATYQSWDGIPALRQDAVLSGRRYWLATDFSTGSVPVTVLMLKNRASVMGGIDASNTAVDRSLADKKGITFVILGVVSAIAVLLPLAVGLWMAARLHKLARGMDRIAQLQFASTTSLPPTMFEELHRFQASFVKMERGLRAFGKFVPQAVVRVLIAGQMNVNEEMHPETLTVMFADIEGFSTVCETVSPSLLVAVCTEYFEAMCSNVVEHNGTIDKFIGDCIMAMWNAPDHLPGHERDAVTAALAMQDSVMALHRSWRDRGLPVLKFRLGLHTGVCLVGNFGCSYRVSYTCLGDRVNLAARLEALNKKFGTYLCVSHATYEGCRDAFHFRRMAKVTVPGKAEVLPVYEVLCAADNYGTPRGAGSPPGCAESPRNRLPLTPHARKYLEVRDVDVEDPADELQPSPVAYHWRLIDRHTLLRHARLYEAAYNALVDGNPSQAQRLLGAKPLLDLPDPAWAALRTQLEGIEAGKPWDGVFHFREK